MSRSFRSYPCTTIVGGSSQKQDKRRCNRIARRTNRVVVQIDGDDARCIVQREALNVYDMAYDGTRRYWPWGRRTASFRTPPTDYRSWWRWAKAK